MRVDLDELLTKHGFVRQPTETELRSMIAELRLLRALEDVVRNVGSPREILNQLEAMDDNTSSSN